MVPPPPSRAPTWIGGAALPRTPAAPVELSTPQRHTRRIGCRNFRGVSRFRHAWGASLLVPERVAPRVAEREEAVFHAHRPDSAADRGRAAEALRRYRARGSLADRGTGRARPRRDAVCQRRFPHFGHLGADVAEGIAPGRLDPRSQCVAHDDARTRAPTRRRVRLPAFSPGLLSVLAVLASADPLRDDAARAARSAGTPAGFHHLLIDPGGLDFERAAPAGAASPVGPHRSSWVAGKSSGSAAGKTELPGFPWAHSSRETRRSRDPHRRPLRDTAENRRESRSGGHRLFRNRDSTAAEPALHRIDRKSTRL